MRKYFQFICLVAFSLASISTPAHAGAWTQKSGEGQVITSFSYYETDAAYNAKSDRVSKTSSYHKSTLDVFAEYGLTDAYTLGLQTSYQWIYARNNLGSFRENDLSDTSFFLRERIWHDDFNVLSLQQLFTVPGPYSTRNAAAPGYGQSDAEFRVLYGHSGVIGGNNYFLDIQGAYRKRFEGPADEVRMDITAGIKPNENFMLLAQSFNTLGMRNESTAAVITSSGPDYDLSKIQISGVLATSYDLSLQLGGAIDVAGRNTGAGKTLFVALWKEF
ncbi:MAG TPA: hypothetical protein PKW15_00920 [Alphaproteobacteria bacterium]|nr:hypothetical protein [Rhodospirillaceae bacterium]HRJ11785.1 hypothetical protein [Alphaproteobacteria bacterium]